jgi:hypothetical protein
MKDQTFPPPPPETVARNYEQLEAEHHAGLHVARNLDVSLTTLGHLVMAAQYALKAPTITATAAAILRDFALDAERAGDFPPQMRQLIAAGWQSQS